MGKKSALRGENCPKKAVQKRAKILTVYLLVDKLSLKVAMTEGSDANGDEGRATR